MHGFKGQGDACNKKKKKRVYEIIKRVGKRRGV